MPPPYPSHSWRWKSAAELYRELKRLNSTACVEDYYEFGIWKDEVMKADIEHLIVHRLEAPVPPLLRDVPMPELPAPVHGFPAGFALGVRPVMTAAEAYLAGVRPVGLNAAAMAAQAAAFVYLAAVRPIGIAAAQAAALALGARSASLGTPATSATLAAASATAAVVNGHAAAVAPAAAAVPAVSQAAVVPPLRLTPLAAAQELAGRVAAARGSAKRPVPELRLVFWPAKRHRLLARAKRRAKRARRSARAHGWMPTKASLPWPHGSVVRQIGIQYWRLLEQQFLGD